jgi:hypothetical protein
MTANQPTRSWPSAIPLPGSSCRRAARPCRDQPQRDEHIQSLADKGRLGWQRETDYGKRPRAETAMARYKRILDDHLHARKLPGQQAEAAIGVAVLNRMIEAGRPDSVRVALLTRADRPSASTLRSLHQRLVNPKHRFRQIETDERRRHRTISVITTSTPSYGTAVPENVQRPSHHADGLL